MTAEQMEAVVALMKAADEAADWIKDTRACAREQGDLDALSAGRRPHNAIAPGERGAPEMRKLRAAIRKAQVAFSSLNGQSPTEEMDNGTA